MTHFVSKTLKLLSMSTFCAVFLAALPLSSMADVKLSDLTKAGIRTVKCPNQITSLKQGASASMVTKGAGDNKTTETVCVGFNGASVESLNYSRKGKRLPRAKVTKLSGMPLRSPALGTIPENEEGLEGTFQSYMFRVGNITPRLNWEITQSDKGGKVELSLIQPETGKSLDIATVSTKGGGGSGSTCLPYGGNWIVRAVGLPGNPAKDEEPLQTQYNLTFERSIELPETQAFVADLKDAGMKRRSCPAALLSLATGRYLPLDGKDYYCSNTGSASDAGLAPINYNVATGLLTTNELSEGGIGGMITCPFRVSRGGAQLDYTVSDPDPKNNGRTVIKVLKLSDLLQNKVEKILNLRGSIDNGKYIFNTPDDYVLWIQSSGSEKYGWPEWAVELSNNDLH